MSTAESSTSSSSRSSSRSATSSKDSTAPSRSSSHSSSKSSLSKCSTHKSGASLHSQKSVKNAAPCGEASRSASSEEYSSDNVSEIETESTVEETSVDERRRLIESYAKYQKTRGKLAQYASTSTQFTAAEKKLSSNNVFGLVQRLYRPQLLLQRTKEDLHRRKGQKKVDNFDSTNDKHLAKYWEHRRQVEAKQSKRREAAAAKRQRQRSTSPPSEKPIPARETSNPRGNDAAVPVPRCLPAIVAQEEGSTKRLIFSNGGRTLLLQDMDNASECSESTVASSLPPISESSASQSLRSTVTQKGVTEAELSGLWLLVDPPPELALSVRGMSVTDANKMGVELSWMAVNKREVARIKEQLPSPHRYGRKKYQLQCQKEGADSTSPAASEPSSRQALVEELVKQVLDSALHMVASGQSPTKSATGSKGPHKGPMGPMVTLLDISLEPHDDGPAAVDISHDSHAKINSPRSGLIMYRNGTSLSDLAPTPFAVFAKEGSLAGVPQFASEKRYLSKESKRRQLLRRLQSEYSALCGEFSRSEFMDVLYAAKPGAAVEDTSTFSQIIDFKRSRQQESAARHAEKLEILVQMAKDKCIDVKAGNEKIQRFENARAAKWKVRAEERERQRDIKARRLQRVKEDAKEIANINRSGILTKLESEEQRRQKLDEKRQHERYLEAEALKEEIEVKRQQKVIHTRLEELKRAQAADRIRQKMSKIERQKKLSEELVKQLRYEQEMAKFRDELTRKAAEEDILAYRRKHQV